MTTKIYALHHGRSKSPVFRLVPNHSTGLYRIEWPDIGLSDRTNLTRAKAAAREWAEKKAMAEGRNLPVARRLKSLDNFSWSTSYVAQNEKEGAR
jgi:hypothetical protein